jgi:CO dehydrogenase maturation factor
LIINRVSGYEGEDLKTLAEELGVHVAGIVPNDKEIFSFDIHGKPIFQLPDSSNALKRLFAIFDSLHIP